jgi:hypothetical protein
VPFGGGGGLQDLLYFMCCIIMHAVVDVGLQRLYAVRPQQQQQRVSRLCACRHVCKAAQSAGCLLMCAARYVSRMACICDVCLWCFFCGRSWRLRLLLARCREQTCIACQGLP